jgi:hypothetical protein
MHRLQSTFAHAAAMSALIVSSAVGPAWASCGSATCFLVTHSEQGAQAAGSFRADLSFGYVDQTRKLDGSSSTSEVLVPKINFETGTIDLDHHREISTRNSKLKLDLSYGVNARVSVFGTLPLVVDKSHEHFDDVGTADEKFTSADGTRGFGDLGVGARYAFLVGKTNLLLGSLTVKLPTGAYKLRDSEGAINEPTIQPGTGSYDGTLALHYVYHPFPSNLEWFAAGSYRRNGRNPLEYTIGDEAILTGGINGNTSGRWIWSVQLNARHAARDEFLGMGVPSTGSVSLTVTPGVRFEAGASLELSAYVQIPAYQKVNEAQLAPRAGFILGIGRTF